MDGFVLECRFGEELSQVEISSVNGAGSDTYHVTIDRLYHGRVWLTEQYGWRHDIHPNSPLQAEDIYIIIDLINEKFDRNPRIPFR